MNYSLDAITLSKLEPFSSFDPARLRELLDYCHVETIPKGGSPFKLFGLVGKSVYLVSGEIELVFNGGNRMVASAQAECAKHPLGKRQPEIVSASALSESQLLLIDQGLLDRMMVLDQVSQHEQIGGDHFSDREITRSYVAANAKRLLNASMFCADSLNTSPLAYLPMTNISVLLSRIEAIAVQEGDVIIREGDDGDYYYLLDSGHAQVKRRVGGMDLLLAELKAGDVFGEEALISDAKRNATVIMKSNGVLLRLGRQDFLELLKEPLLHKISYEDAIKTVEQGAVWLDVGSPPEYRYDRLRDAMNVPLNDVRNAVGVLDRNRKYIAYCQSGRRSAAATFIMAQAGYDVQVLEGGLWSVPKSAQYWPNENDEELE